MVTKMIVKIPLNVYIDSTGMTGNKFAKHKKEAAQELIEVETGIPYRLINYNVMRGNFRIGVKS